MHFNRNSSSVPLRTARQAALPAYGLWIKLGFVGMSVVAGGLVELLGRASSPVTASAWVLAGIALAGLSWRRAIAALKVMESSGDEAVAANAPKRAPVDLHLPDGIARA